MTVHIYPLNDTHEHILDEDCPCSPTQNKNGHWIHKSFDGRENMDNNGQPPFNWTFDITDNNE